MLKDNVCERSFAKKRNLDRYSLEDALVRVKKNGPLLKGISVHILPSSQEQTKKEMECIVKAAGGTWLTRWQNKLDDPNMLLLGERVKFDKIEKQRRNQYKVYDVELLREAALTQVLRKNVYLLRTPAEEEAKERQQLSCAAKSIAQNSM